LEATVLIISALLLPPSAFDILEGDFLCGVLKGYDDSIFQKLKYFLIFEVIFNYSLIILK